jgi:hypothetical protein
MDRIDRVFALLPDRTLMRAEAAYGAFLKRAANHRIGRVLVRISHRALARVTGRVLRLTRATEGQAPAKVAKRTMEKFFLPILEPLREDDASFSFEFHECPYGLKNGAEPELCHAIMNLEEELMKELGGRLVIEERIAEGAPRCRFTVKTAMMINLELLKVDRLTQLEPLGSGAGERVGECAVLRS